MQRIHCSGNIVASVVQYPVLFTFFFMLYFANNEVVISIFVVNSLAQVQCQHKSSYWGDQGWKGSNIGNIVFIFMTIFQKLLGSVSYKGITDF